MKIVRATTNDKDIALQIRIYRGVEASASLPVTATPKDFFDRVRGVVQGNPDPTFKPVDFFIGAIDSQPADLFLDLGENNHFVFSLKQAGQDTIIARTEISFDDMHDAVFVSAHPSQFPALAIMGRRLELPNVWAASQTLQTMNQWIFGACAGILVQYKNPHQKSLAAQLELNNLS